MGCNTSCQTKTRDKCCYWDKDKCIHPMDHEECDVEECDTYFQAEWYFPERSDPKFSDHCDTCGGLLNVSVTGIQSCPNCGYLSSSTKEMEKEP